MITSEEIVAFLRKKQLPLFNGLENVTVLVQGLRILEIVKDNTDFKKITTKTISKVLADLVEINVSEIALARAFARAGSKVKSYKEDGITQYEIMGEGRTFLKSQYQNMDANEVFFFSGRNAWSDLNVHFPKMINLLKGDLCIVDPFYGHGTFTVLEKFGKHRKIRLMSAQLGDQEQKNEQGFDDHLNRFKSEFKNVKLRKYPNKYELHDRYIIAENALVIVGHGIKDIASKESFVVYLPDKMVSEFLPMLRDIFEERWNKAQNI